MAEMDTTFCDTYVDFNVPDKPNPPPIELVAKIWKLWRSLPTGKKVEKYAIEFTDMTGQLAATVVPLNTWVQVDRSMEVTGKPPVISFETNSHKGDEEIFPVYLVTKESLGCMVLYVRKV